MRQSCRRLILFVLVLSAPIGATSQQTEPREKKDAAEHERLLGIGINEGSIGFQQALSAAQSAGIQFVEIPNHWDDIERTPGKFTNQWLDIADAFYPQVNIGLVISLNPIDTNNLRLPADLRDKPMDDPVVIERYNAAADYILSRAAKSKIVAFAIGNEIDGVLGNDPKKWQQFERFFKATSEHVRSQHPDIVVGTKIMLKSLIGPTTKELAGNVNTHADAVLATYYPLDNGFQVKSTAAVNQDLDDLLQQYPNRPVYLLEAGCPSSELLSSSEKRQAEFVRELFRYWDNHSQLKAVNFIWLHDISAKEVENYAKYYGVNHRTFSEYLGTLGLRHHDGTNKAAFEALREEAKSRGW